MKTLLSLLLVVATVYAVQAQGQPAAKGNGKITGNVTDNTTKQPVEFATVALTDLTSDKPINGAICDEKGKFIITKVPNGAYRLIISFIGYENIVVDNVVISDKKNSIDVGSVKMATASKELDAVVVEGQRVLVEEKVDRTVSFLFARVVKYHVILHGYFERVVLVSRILLLSLRQPAPMQAGVKTTRLNPF